MWVECVHEGAVVCMSHRQVTWATSDTCMTVPLSSMGHSPWAIIATWWEGHARTTSDSNQQERVLSPICDYLSWQQQETKIDSQQVSFLWEVKDKKQGAKTREEKRWWQVQAVPRGPRPGSVTCWVQPAPHCGWDMNCFTSGEEIEEV